MEEVNRHGQVGRAAMKADMDRKTARKYVGLGKLPSEAKAARTWETRSNPFAKDWAWIEEQLKATPEFEAKTLFESLQAKQPGHYQDGQLRSLQRHIKRWRAERGPEQALFFAQKHRPGEAMQTDFTDARELGVTIAGIAFAHLLCHVVLPYSNWQWVTVSLSESYLALKRGLQAALFRLGRRPDWHQTDNSTSATHKLEKGKRAFNKEYEDFIEHHGMKARTTGVGEKEQNGDVEAANGALKRWLEQQLLVRRSRDFETVEEYESWIQAKLAPRNAGRRERLERELAAMAPVSTARLPEYREHELTITDGATMRVEFNTYSVPSRLRGETVRVRVFERSVQVWYARKLQLTTERLVGRHGHRINYRHIIWAMVRKPGAFARYRYRDDLFPSRVFRQAYDAIYAAQPDTRGDLEYLRLLHLAAGTSEADVETALGCLMDDGQVPNADAVKELIGESNPKTPDLAQYEVELAPYDELLEVAS